MSLFKRPEQPRQRPTIGPATPSGASTANEVIPPGTRVAPSKLAEARALLEDGRAFAPHCDQRILHEPGECWSCDLYPDWQKLRELWGIDFSGHSTPGKLPCPADYHRPPNSPSDHRRWPNNRAEKDRG